MPHDPKLLEDARRGGLVAVAQLLAVKSRIHRGREMVQEYLKD